MGQYRQSVVTDAGNALITQAIAGDGNIQFTEVKTSSYAYPQGTNIAALTDLQNIEQSVIPSSAQIFNNTMLQISASFSNTGVEAEYLIQTIGIYAKITDGTETLFAVCTATTPDQMPEQSEVAPSACNYNIQITVSRASSITVTVDPAGAASKADLTALQQQVTNLENTVTVNIAEITTIAQVSVPVSAWQGSAAPYTATVNVANITADSRPEIYLYYPDTITSSNYEDYIESYGYINKADTGAGTITFTCFGDKPTVDLTITVKGY